MIDINNVSKYYGKHQVLDAINLRFKKGKIYGVVGENGVGKSTLFKCISGLETYTGEIVYDNGSLKDKIGLLLTEPYFFSKITGKEYINLLTKARGINYIDCKVQNIFDLPLNEYAFTYSTGMKKKLALTAILAQNNDVFILDEPFNGVDVQSNVLIIEILKQLQYAGKTIIISSHIISTLTQMCNTIFVMESDKTILEIDKSDFERIENDMKAKFIKSKLEHFKV